MKASVIPSYAADVRGLRGNLQAMLPPSALTAFDAYAEELDKSFTNILKVKKGDHAPQFALSNAVGETVSLTDILSKGKAVLVFYRGFWCPYCSLQLNQLQSALESIKGLGTSLIAISPRLQMLP